MVKQRIRTKKRVGKPTLSFLSYTKNPFLFDGIDIALAHFNYVILSFYNVVTKKCQWWRFAHLSYV